MNKTFRGVVVVVLFIGILLAFNNIYRNKNMRERNNVVNTQSSISDGIEIRPIEHATMALKWDNKIVYTDPVGGAAAFLGQPEPDLILLTDIHSDHFDVETLKAVSRAKTIIVAPMAVADMMPSTIPGDLLVIKNGQKTNQKTSKKVNLNGFSIEAIPMYNLPEKKDSYHVKGRGNGYVLETGGKQVYISGDTSNTPEMRNLKNIDIAFVSMNLPYTMNVDSAASGVLAFKPKEVYPYHYRGEDGFSDLNKFKELVNKGDPNIKVVLLNWYPR